MQHHSLLSSSPSSSPPSSPLSAPPPSSPLSSHSCTSEEPSLQLTTSTSQDFVPNPPHHLETRSLKEFLQLPSNNSYKYQLLEGIVCAYPSMVGRDHTSSQSVLQLKIETWNHHKPDNEKIKAHIEAEIAREPSDNFSSSSTPPRVDRTTCLRADVAVGPLGTYEERQNLSDLEKICHFPPHADPPLLVIEITSPSNSFNDLVIKVNEYSSRGILQYVIVHREQNRVIVYKDEIDHSDQGGKRLRRSSRERSLRSVFVKDCIYKSVVIYEGNDTVQAKYLKDLGLTANYMLNPPEESADIINKEQKRASDERKRANDEEHLRTKAEEERNIEKDKRKTAEKERNIAEEERNIEKDKRKTAEKERNIAEKERDIEKDKRKKSRMKRKQNREEMIKEMEKDGIDICKYKKFMDKNCSSEGSSGDDNGNSSYPAPNMQR